MIITFYGADAKCGTTMICQAVAEQLAEIDKSKRILLMHCDGKPGTEYSNAMYLFCLDDIGIKLSSKVMTGAELESVCTVSGNLWMLRGTDSYIERRKYQPEMIKSLFEMAKESFDYVVVDAGSSVDLGMTIGSLLYADRRILVTTQSKTAGETFLKKQQQILSELGIEFDALLVNRLYNSYMLPGIAEAKAKYKISKACSIDFSEYGIQAETENRPLLKLDGRFRRDVDAAVQYLFFNDDEGKNERSNLWRNSILRSIWRG